MISIPTNGLIDVGPFRKKKVPLFLTDEYEVLEGPTYWAAHVAKIRSRSGTTLKQYTSILSRFLQWLDDRGYGVENWQSVDREIIEDYYLHLKIRQKEKNYPSDDAIDDYLGRLQNFYKWADKEGFPHYWDMNVEVITKKFDFDEGSQSQMVKSEVEVETLDVKAAGGKRRRATTDLEKFIRKEDFLVARRTFDDFVYSVIATVIWMTALRPKELFQLPFLGTGSNSGFRRYEISDLDELDDIYFEFASKGKDRSIDFPGYLWAWICKYWMPIRAERAKIYRAKNRHGLSNDVLFISADGVPVSYNMLSKHFRDVNKAEDYKGNKFCAKALRHSFATYLVHKALKNARLIGKPYVYHATIDDELRRWLGHEDISTTYKFYVHLVNRFTSCGDDLIYEMSKKENMMILDAFTY